MATRIQIDAWQRADGRGVLDARAVLDVARVGCACAPPRLAACASRTVCRLDVDACKAATPAAESLAP